MNFSLKNRIFISFFLALFIVLATGLNVYFYLDKLNKQIQSSSIKISQENLLIEEMRVTLLNIISAQKKISTKIAREDDLQNMTEYLTQFSSQLETLTDLVSDSSGKTIAQMQGFVKSMNTLIKKTEDSGKERWKIPDESRKTIQDNTDYILTWYTQFLEKRQEFSKISQKKTNELIQKTKDNMLLTLILSGLGAILLSMIIPAKIALPFRKIKDAIRELQDCNFDVSIYYNEQDEIGEIASEINKMIRNLKRFEELRIDKISVEQRKFDVLANMIKKNVMVANGSGKVVYINNTLYSILNLKSDDVIGKAPDEAMLPSSIKEIFELAIKRRTKIENEPLEFQTKRFEEDEVIEEDYQGFANIIPIRGKDSNLDYYVMILSQQVFV